MGVKIKILDKDVRRIEITLFNRNGYVYLLSLYTTFSTIKEYGVKIVFTDKNNDSYYIDLNQYVDEQYFCIRVV